MGVVFGLADRISVVVYGQVIATGTPAEIRGNAAVKEAYLGRRRRPHERADSAQLLRVENLQAYYGKSHVLHGVDLTVGRGEIVSLLGRNGVGRSTTAKAIMGLVDCTGTVDFRATT